MGTSQGAGVYGKGVAGVGVVGESQEYQGLVGKSATYIGIEGVSSATGYEGVLGECSQGTGVEGRSDTQQGVWGICPQGIGVAARGARGIVSEAPRAADLFGDVYVGGALLHASAGSTMDHPLDPEGRYLEHSVVESSERKNVYDGVVDLDGDGRAIVELPGWFEALNEDFRYQLTPIGAPAPDLHVGQELAGNCFAIAGGPPNRTVSWQVTGVRRDAWSRAHPLECERVKPPEELGRYLHPEEHGQPRERSSDALPEEPLPNDRGMPAELDPGPAQMT
ncbi:hypothetical protein [Streptomyces palmae]|nr:hypothetical protein [Streptomyces palmae]